MPTKMEFQPRDIAGVLVITPDIISDERGFFLESFRQEEFRAMGIPGPFVQDNHSGSKQGVLRGLHYQILRPQGKLVHVVVGEVYDVIVDLRKNSPTFGKWIGEYLSAKNARQIWIPSGCAHGFYVRSPRAEVLYKATDYYSPEGDRTLRWDDPALGIRWPLLDGAPPILSEKDKQGKLLFEAEHFE
jgi:dTDP-4-dehydrorhamnose 3,5-epimerase